MGGLQPVPRETGLQAPRYRCCASTEEEEEGGSGTSAVRGTGALSRNRPPLLPRRCAVAQTLCSSTAPLTALRPQRQEKVQGFIMQCEMADAILEWIQGTGRSDVHRVCSKLGANKALLHTQKGHAYSGPPSSRGHVLFPSPPKRRTNNARDRSADLPANVLRHAGGLHSASIQYTPCFSPTLPRGPERNVIPQTAARRRARQLEISSAGSLPCSEDEGKHPGAVYINL
ncbi:hypothetical protein SKAU_G00306800 [Synaphobranchus kaupii]|uniref:Uncharacterized protein n=1 Tax=Synaphobranchus kaupii TaxID=118154 RepID=A0A9Q1EQR1_SYNKA|nr:hypothetical protein SKAU_G00306800 [Synaphobranchus kaupii]